MKTRIEIANELLQGCPEESLSDHQKIAQMLKNDDSVESILDSKEVNNWPETYTWLRDQLA